MYGEGFNVYLFYCFFYIEENFEYNLRMAKIKR